MKRLQRILVFTKVEHTARREIVKGIGLYARQGHHWQPHIPWADLDKWILPENMKVDGVIAFPQTPAEIDFLLGLQLPVVCVGSYSHGTHFPRVEWDDEMAGRLAADHLVEAGLKRIVFIGRSFQESYILKRLEGVRSVGLEHGLELETLELEPGGHRAGKDTAVEKRTMKWLRKLEPPFGVVAATDSTGFEVLNSLRSIGIDVPEQAAVISIGGDNVLCPFCEPPLSSVVLPGEKVGYEAARLLDQLMAVRGTKRKNGEEILIPPRRVAALRSSDVIATGDVMVRHALSFIRDHASEPISVCDVLAAVPLSRRPLELRFKRDTGRTLQKEIWRVRLSRVKEMLIETDLSIADIADRCGFSEPQRLTEVFTRELGIAPAAYRKSHHLADR